jgi:hypothetical protein
LVLKTLQKEVLQAKVGHVPPILLPLLLEQRHSNSVCVFKDGQSSNPKDLPHMQSKGLRLSFYTEKKLQALLHILSHNKNIWDLVLSFILTTPSLESLFFVGRTGKAKPTKGKALGEPTGNSAAP